MKDQKLIKAKPLRALSGKKQKLENVLDVHCANQSNENISIKIPMFEISSDCVQETINEQFDGLQTREEIIVSKNVHMDCNSLGREPEIEVKHQTRGRKSKKVNKSLGEDSAHPQETNDHIKSVDSDMEIEVKPLTRWGKYKKLYKTHWEEDPNLKEWIQPLFDDPHKVSCRWCNCAIRAHKADLYKHAGTNKHKKNFNLSHEENESNKGIIFSVSPKNSKKRKFKTEKVPTNDGSYIILQTEQNTPAYHSEPDHGSIFMDYGDDDDIGEGVKSVSFSESRSVPDRDISNIASRIGIVLIEEIEKILRSQKNVLKYFKENGEISLTDSNVKRMAKICIGHLSQRYLVESALEPPRLKSPSVYKENKELTSKFRAIEEKLEKTVLEMKDLKMSFDGVSQVLPFTQIDLGEIFNSASTD